MSDEIKKPDQAVLEELKAAVEDFVLEETKGYLRIAKEIEADINWQSYGGKLIGVYLQAIKEEIGETAAQQFVQGVIERVSN